MRWFWIVALLIFFPIAAPAQTEEEDKGRIARFLEGALSGAGRQVSIEGFRGALSSETSIAKLTVADDTGPWLVIENAVLNWNMAAVLRGRVQISKLAADQIEVLRTPRSEPEVTPEAGEFSLPELPVSVEVAELSVPQIVLGETVLGQPLRAALQGAFSLVGGEGTARIKLRRTDEKIGQIGFDGAYSNATRRMRIDFNANEDKDGVIATILGLHQSPAIDFSVNGDGSFDRFRADILLASEGEQRLSGFVETDLPEKDEAQNTSERLFLASLKGDLAPLFLPEYRDFFGDKISFDALLRNTEDNRFVLEQMQLDSRTLRARGTMALSADKLPEQFDFEVELADPQGVPVPLPLSGPLTHISRADFRARFDQSIDNSWALTGEALNIVQNDIELGRIGLEGSGQIQRAVPQSILANVRADLTNLKLGDADMARAVGRTVQLDTNLFWERGKPLDLTSFELIGENTRLNITGKLDGFEDDLAFRGKADARFSDLSVLSPFVQRELRGAMTLGLEGSASFLSGQFDLKVSGAGEKLSFDEDLVDALIAGSATLSTSVRRDEKGLLIRNATLSSDALKVTANGSGATGNSKMRLNARLDDLARLVPDLAGPVTLAASARQEGSRWQGQAEVAAPADSKLAVKFDRKSENSLALDASGTIGTLAILVPELAGSAEFDGQAKQNAEGWIVDADAKSSTGTSLQLVGQVSEAFDTADLALAGSAPAAMANRFIAPNSLQGTLFYDLLLKGPLSLSGLSGSIQTSGTRVSVPAAQIALTDLNGAVQISEGTASINAKTNLSQGGAATLSGSVSMSAPFTSTLQMNLADVGYSYQSLFSTSVGGTLAFNGPLTGGGRLQGGLTLGPTDVRIDGSAGSIASIPEIEHRAEPFKVRRTREWARLIKSEKETSSSAPIALELKIDAPNRIFVDGLGLNSEFGGSLTLAGTTKDVLPIGEFRLLRGRLDFAGKRFDIEKGQVRLEGDFVPYVQVFASHRTREIEVLALLQGPVDDPELTLDSSPSLPEDEILSQLLFGSDLSSISPIQAAQLASAVATLSGGGGRIDRNRLLFDDIDIVTDEEGQAGLRVGKYINENIYTDVSVDGKGESTVNLNIDLNDNVTLRGRVESDSDTAIGIYMQRDY